MRRRTRNRPAHHYDRSQVVATLLAHICLDALMIRLLSSPTSAVCPQSVTIPYLWRFCANSGNAGTIKGGGMFYGFPTRGPSMDNRDQSRNSQGTSIGRLSSTLHQARLRLLSFILPLVLPDRLTVLHRVQMTPTTTVEAIWVLRFRVPNNQQGHGKLRRP
jgi:hypothetical protein